METFEDRLKASAKRMAEEDNKQLRIPDNPTTGKRTYWGWIAAPAAAVIGIVFGLSLPGIIQETETEGNIAKVINMHDTIEVPKCIKDTIYLTQTKVVEREKIVWRERQQTPQPPKASNDELTQCTSSRCDGINYSMLIAN